MSRLPRLKDADLRILLQEGEGTTLEFKESVSSSLAREMVAFANTIGGRILLGVRDDASVAGMKDSNSVRARIQDMARNCDPPVKVVVEPVGMSSSFMSAQAMPSPSSAARASSGGRAR